MQPIISVVTGTINRLPLLIEMVESARKEARGLPINFVIVDSGSVDGTEAWCNTQADITLVQLGKKTGGIRAFTDGVKAVSDSVRYTILANDDITFMPYSILSAYRLIEDNPTIGAVAFADDRNHPPKFETQRHLARNANGVQVGTVYAQVGLYRTPLIKEAGGWGADDPEFGGAGAWTYGGDDYATSRIWELGFTIGTTPLAKIHDRLHADDTRAVGYQKGRLDGELYHKRFPNGGAIFGARLADIPKNLDTTTQLRIIHLPVIEPMNTPQRYQMVGLSEELATTGDVIRYEYTLRAGEIGKLEMLTELYNITKVFKPDIILMQCHDTSLINESFVRSLREASLRNDDSTAFIMNWNGDYWRQNLFEASMLHMLRACDVQLVVDYAVIPMYADKGITARYWQVAPETPNLLPVIEDAPTWDILFMGAVYSDSRRELVRYLHGLKSEGFKVGLYGNGYPKGIKTEGATYYDYQMTQAIMSKAGIVIGAMEFADSDGYVSNRLFEALQAGATLLQQRVINADKHLGLLNGVHYAVWDSIQDLDTLIRYYLRERKLALDMAERGQKFVRERHSHKNRIDELFNIIREAKIS